MNSARLANHVEKLWKNQSADSLEALRDRLTPMLSTSGYESITLFSPDGNELLSLGHATEGLADSQAQVQRSLSTGAPVFVGLQRKASGQLHLNLIAAITRQGRADGALIGVALLQISPERFLFPLIQHWPTPSASAEGNLVRLDDGQVLFLNPQRHGRHQALLLRLPLDTPGLPAAEALRSHEPGVTEGFDYRGTPVLAAYHPVAGTAWRVVVKMDRSEALAASLQMARWLAAVIASALMVLGTAVAVVLRQQQQADRLAAQVASDQLIRQFYSMPFVGMAITSPKSKVWTQFNDRLCEIFGYPREELAKLTWSELTHPEDLSKDLALFESTVRGEIDRYTLDKRFVRKDGKVIFANIDVRCVRLANGRPDYFVAMVEDISERKAAEARDERLKNLYAGLSRCNAAIAQCADQQSLLDTVCAIAVESASLKLCWVGFADDEGWITPAAAHGLGTEYLKDIRIATQAGNALGLGPTGTAVRENRPVWCDDFLHDPRTAPWHERGRQFGWGASGSLPILRNGKACGSLSLYAEQPFAFDDEARRLLADLADAIGLAMDKFDAEAARGRAEQEVLETRRRMDDVLANIDQVIWSVDANTRELLYMNEAAQRIYGRPVADLIARPELWLDMLHPDDRALALQKDRDARKHGRSEVVYRIIDTRGEVRWIRDQTVLVRDEAGQPLRLDGVASDITAGKLAAQARVEAEQQFKSLVEQSIAGIYILQDRRFVYVNPRFAAILGYDAAEDLIGREAYSLLPPDAHDQVRATIAEQNQAHAEPVAYTTPMIRKDGSRVEVGVQGTHSNYLGRPAVIGMIQDITEKKRAEEEIQRYTEQLRTAFMRTVEVATTLAEMRDPYTAGHERRVADIAVAIGREMGMDERRLEGLRVAGYLHDIGKITVPAEILVKPGRLSAAEFELIKGHAQAGYEVLKNVGFPWPVAQMVLQHHERMDGSGYPQGLKGDAILLEARILCVADVLESMSSHRPYRPGLGIDKALAELERGRGSVYDAPVVDHCLALVREKDYRIPQ